MVKKFYVNRGGRQLRNVMEMRNVWGYPNLYAPDKDERKPVMIIEEV